MDPAAHKELVRSQFSLQAKHHPTTVKYRRGENVVPMIDLAEPQKSDRVLDVASGPGFVALQFSGKVRAVVGVDLLPEMNAMARKTAADQGVANVEFIEGDAEDLKFPDGSFEIVTCRFTFHHFGDPGHALTEMKRVLAPGGRIILYDFLASSDEEKAKVHNEIELMRDPSHVRIYRLEEFQDLFGKAGLREAGRVTTLMKRNFGEWMAYLGADTTLLDRVRARFEETVDGDATGLGVRISDGKIVFSHTCVCWKLMAAGKEEP